MNVPTKFATDFYFFLLLLNHFYGSTTNVPQTLPMWRVSIIHYKLHTARKLLILHITLFGMKLCNMFNGACVIRVVYRYTVLPNLSTFFDGIPKRKTLKLHFLLKLLFSGSHQIVPSKQLFLLVHFHVITQKRWFTKVTSCMWLYYILHWYVNTFN